jgi:hypothetical protein
MVINRFLFSKKKSKFLFFLFSSQFLTFFLLLLPSFADDLADLLETEPHSASQEEDVAQHLERLNVGAAAPSQGAGGKSCAGGIYSVPGSAHTESRALNNDVSNARYKNPAMDDEELTDAVDDVQGRGKAPYVQTQVSGDNRRKKKVSVVKEPVYQNIKRKRNAKSPPALEKSAPPTKRGGLRSNRRAVKAER